MSSLNLKAYVGKAVTLTDVNNKIWNGIVESYNPNDYVDEYEGESIDFIADKGEMKTICFAKPDIVSIEVL